MTQSQLQQFYPVFNLLVTDMLLLCEDKMAANITHLYVLLKYFSSFVSEDKLLEILTTTDLTIENEVIHEEIKFVLNKLDEYSTTKAYIGEHWQQFFMAAIESATESYDINGVFDSLGYYDLYEDKWSQDEQFLSVLKDKINQLYPIGNIDLSYKHDRICTAYYEGFKSEALSMVEAEILEDYSNFLAECNLSNYYEEFSKDVDFDSHSVLDAVIENYGTFEEEYDPSDRINGDTASDENSAIERLFER